MYTNNKNQSVLTPQENSKNLADFFGINNLFIKREDLHNYGSHKGRSIPLMIDLKIKEGFKKFAISSSGNASLSAIKHVNYLNSIIDNKKLNEEKISLFVFIGKNINQEKKQRLLTEADSFDCVKIIESDKPLQSLFDITKDGKVASLRQSNDNNALLGYESLAKEIFSIPNLTDVFVAVSSGTTAEALADYIILNKLNIRLNIVQTNFCHPIVNDINNFIGDLGIDNNEENIADAIVDKIALRRKSLSEKVNHLKGFGIIANSDDILKAKRLLWKKAGIQATANGALALAGLVKIFDKDLLKNNCVQSFKNSSVLIIIGGL